MELPSILLTNKNWMSGKAYIFGQYLYSLMPSKRCDEFIKSLRLFCLFIGYPRSGHSLIGSLIDAHPNSVISNELDSLKYVKAGFSRKQIYYLIIRNSEKYSKQGRYQTGYNYNVPNQWQGKFKHLGVIGDKKGGMTTQHLSSNPELLDDLKNKLGIPIKIIHVVRNPFDNISTMAFRTKSTISKETVRYFNLCLKNTLILDMVDNNNIITIRHENLVADKISTLKRIVTFLQLEEDQGYLNDCSSIIYRSPNKSREKYKWNKREIELVEEQMDGFPFLTGYTFQN